MAMQEYAVKNDQSPRLLLGTIREEGLITQTQTHKLMHIRLSKLALHCKKNTIEHSTENLSSIYLFFAQSDA